MPNSLAKSDKGRLKDVPKRERNKRTEKIKEVQAQELRKKFQAVKFIDQLEKCYEDYEEFLNELSVAKIKKRELRGKRKDKVKDLAEQIDILKLKIDVTKNKIDLNMRRLKFCLPELRSVELKDPEGNNPMSGFMGILREALQKDE